MNLHFQLIEMFSWKLFYVFISFYIVKHGFISAYIVHYARICPKIIYATQRLRDRKKTKVWTHEI